MQRAWCSSECQVEARHKTSSIQIEVPPGLTKEPDVASHHVVRADACRAVAFQVPWRLVLLAQPQRDYGLVRADAVEEARDEPPSRGVWWPQHDGRQRRIDGRLER